MQSINIMKRHWLSLAIASFGLTLMFNPVAASAAPQVFEASGVTPNDILNTVTAFRNFLGDNNGIGGTFPTGSSAPWIATSRKHFSLYLELHNRQRARGSAPCSPM